MSEKDIYSRAFFGFLKDTVVLVWFSEGYSGSFVIF